MSFSCVSLLLILINLWCCIASNDTICSSDDGSLVDTDYGCVRGIVNNLGRSFTSIPFAKPPTLENNLRFKNPEEPNDWDYILDATEIAPGCMQTCVTSEDIGCPTSNGAVISEDCLYLNVYTPPFTPNDPKPVLFWIHGGSYEIGWSGSDLYNGQNMAFLNNVIVVTINYRLGSFGFYYNPENGFQGNYGFFDQQFALKFVHDNIEYFGGDKSKIILFGESAGAMSVSTLLINTSNTMISGAIMESNILGIPLRTSDSWENIPSKYVEFAGCKDSTNGIEDCMRNEVSSEVLLNAQNNVTADLFADCKLFQCYWIHTFLTWSPTFETEAFPQTQPLQAFQDGEYIKVPMIMGSNKDEAALFIYPLVESIFGDYTHGLCSFEYKALIYAIMGTYYGDIIIEEYKDLEPQCIGGDYRPLLTKMVTDFWFICPTKNASDHISQESVVWKYLYEFFYSFPDFYHNNTYCLGEDGYVCHGDELPIVFQPKTFDNFTQQETDLSDLIQIYWTNLARFGYPGSVDGVKWTHSDQDSEWMMVFTDNGMAEMHKDYEKTSDDRCDFWDDLGYPQLWWQDQPTFVFGEEIEAKLNVEAVGDCNRICN